MKNNSSKTSFNPAELYRSAAVLSRSHRKTLACCGSGQPRSENAFTLSELFVVIAMAGLLAVICLSAMARTGPDTQAFQCLNNHKQLMRAFRMYADDNNDVMVHSGNGGPIRNGRPVWMTGTLSFNGVGTPGWVNWWVGIGSEPGSPYLAGGPLWGYTGQQPAIYKCPADPVVINASGSMPLGFKAGQYPRVRSISMSQVFGAGDWQPASEFKLYSIYSTIDRPSKTQVFMDEHPNSLNDAAFGWSDDPQAIVDVPAAYHNGRGAGFGFADGHGEIHRWLGDEISPPFIPGNTSLLGPGRHNPITPGGILDVAWMCDNNTAHR